MYSIISFSLDIKEKFFVYAENKQRNDNKKNNKEFI